ncbi:hypothetical protein ACIQBJ_31720 [Kitasatospora sp. NPDC088391]|uniref:hypothetical protein n=1 Tax=Kitasatospora sp. NPDC088391 TaxID=3364074 RepID=UPI00382F9FA7
MNGDGPFVITGWLPHSNRSHLQLNLVGGGPSGSMMVHTPEDITFYYFAVEPSAAESDNALAEIRKRAMRNLGL